MVAGSSGRTASQRRAKSVRSKALPCSISSLNDVSSRMAVAEHVAVVDDDDLAQARQPFGSGEHLVDMLLVFGDEHRCAAMPQHEFRLVARTGRIKPIADRADALRSEIGEQPLGQRIANDGDTVAGANPKGLQGKPDPRTPGREAPTRSVRDKRRAT